MPKHITPSKIHRLKQEAKKLKVKYKCTQNEALNRLAVREGYGNWKAIVKESDKALKTEPISPQPSLRFVESEDISLSEDEKKNLKYERTTDLNDAQKVLVADNRVVLAGNGIEYSMFEPTRTGLKKSILDATQPVRTHFNLTGFHDFPNQVQGTEHKIMKTAFFVTPQSIEQTKMSLYRPNTKKGDPRMWFKSLGGFSEAGDQIAIIVLNDQAYLINLSQANLEQSIVENNCIAQFIQQYCESATEVSTELLQRLREIAKKPLPALGTGDTTIGMSIEAALGIKANSNKNPDYKGIEIKSGRGGKNRTTLFAQVADWRISPCKSSREILDKYGYERGEDFKLYCTINSQKINSQGLSFKYNDKTDELIEYHSDGEIVAVWPADLLRKRLSEKHAETFWIDATSEIIDGKEYFTLNSVIHTKAPLLNQLMPLLESGVITMDHLIKRKGGEKPKVSEKGPLFKMDKKNLSLLFPKPVSYSLKSD